MIPYFSPPVFHIGALEVHAFGLAVCLAILAGHPLALRRARTLGLDERRMSGIYAGVAVAAAVAGHLGAMALGRRPICSRSGAANPRPGSRQEPCSQSSLSYGATAPMAGVTWTLSLLHFHSPGRWSGPAAFLPTITSAPPPQARSAYSFPQERVSISDYSKRC
jgi:hypothetical protein